MTSLVDTHCHLHDRSTYDYVLSQNPKVNPADFTPEAMLKTAAKNGVEKIVCIGTTHEDSLRARDFAAAHDNIFWTYGIHPEEASGVTAGDCAEAEPSLAIGEIGLDYHRPGYNKSAQIQLLEQMLDLAVKNELPVVFHVRDAFDDFWPIFDNFSKIKTAVIHSFSDNEQNLRAALNRDLYIGVNGLATFTNIPIPPLECTVLETDAPFLAPAPFRGQPNQPAHIKSIAEHLAAHHHVPLEDVAEITTSNAHRLFGW